ncbi:TIGR03086 family metal-binding protein [Nocardia sp. XZ_19_385]|uniref:TIGR03086 family metal-binding protein n=1 Tax=Nocardia sp. XZ_19_385 TaxID=2769488 RepID=UPI00188E53C0|nr:TIGR03086 family metal-binding protein [Nocardia sp. XZ_19_385]
MIDLKPACAAMIELLTEITDAQLTLPTPCSKYRVEDLLVHLDEVVRGSAALARKEQEPVASAAVPGPAVLAERVQLLGVAWDDPAAWQGATPAGSLELANELWARIAFTEIVVHGWDLARALDRPFILPDHTLRACLDHVAEFIPNSPVPELWSPAVPTPGDAPLIDRIVAITGRNPRWTAESPENVE